MKKEKKPWRPLLAIPIAILICLLIVILCGYLDVSIASPDPDNLGHPAPFFSIFALLGAPVVCAIVAIVSIVKTVLNYKRRKNEPCTLPDN